MSDARVNGAGGVGTDPEVATYGPVVAAPTEPVAHDAARDAALATARQAEREVRDRAALLRMMRREPTSFAFMQAVRLLGRLRPDRAAVGGWADPADEVARFGVHPSLGFPPAEIQSIDLPESTNGGTPDDGPPARFAVNFFGLTGPQGVLPHVYTEHVAARTRARDTAMRDFLDLFHHRALSLYYRAWQQGHVATAHETGQHDRLYEHLLDIAGVGSAGLRERLPAADEALAFYSGLLAGRVRHADGLARIVGDYFAVPTEVEQFAGEWRRVDVGGQVTLGAPLDAGRLGFGILGDAAWDAEARVRLRLGPLTRPQFDAFLPGGDAHSTLVALARLYADDQVGVDAQLVLLRGAVAGCTLGAPVSGGPAQAAPAGAPRLGRGSWLASRPMPRDPDDTVLTLC
ncbi:MAG: type VI secretion system baseplate subunit TssG [Gemmatirosa sp.]